METQALTDTVRRMMDTAAGHYARDIAPVNGALAADLVAYAAPQPDDCVLDIGCGNGVVARALIPYVRRVTGLDLSAGILRAARRLPTPARIVYIQGDISAAPFRPAAFTLAVASFGLNVTDPGRSLRAVRRLLAPRGRLVLQEWGPAAPADRAISDALAAHAVDDPGAELAALRAAMARDPWDAHLQDTDDYRAWLADAGFTVRHVAEAAPLTLHMPPDAFLRYKLAWTTRRTEVDAMPPATRAAFYADVRARLAALCASDGRLAWQPVLFRATAG